MSRRYPADDALNRINEVYLGPKDWTLPWRARYRAYGLAFPVFLFTFAAIHRAVGGVVAVTWAAAATVVITTLLMRTVSPDVPFRSKLSTAAAELTVPRPGRAEGGSRRWPTIR